MRNLIRSWIFVYGILYVAAVLLGTRVAGVPDIITIIGLMAVAALCWIIALTKNKWLCLGGAFLWGAAVMANWMLLIPWIPTYSNLQYTVMALLDLGQAIACMILSGCSRNERF